ncbi:hypothetical protein BC828DRAFT_223336 [Blastocladiella britannica]|nr:hypothetical protein BC828DRAFT_223336 [Blastocladiella britannica]
MAPSCSTARVEHRNRFCEMQVTHSVTRYASQRCSKTQIKVGSANNDSSQNAGRRRRAAGRAHYFLFLWGCGDLEITVQHLTARGWEFYLNGPRNPGPRPWHRWYRRACHDTLVKVTMPMGGNSEPDESGSNSCFKQKKKPLTKCFPVEAKSSAPRRNKIFGFSQKAKNLLRFGRSYK